MISKLSISNLNHYEYNIIAFPEKLQANNIDNEKLAYIGKDKSVKLRRGIKRLADLSEFPDIDYTPKGFAHYIRNLGGKGSEIFQFIFARRGLSDMYIKNETIAEYAKCSTRTVRNWTTRFMSEGILIKRQFNSNIFDVNHFYLHPRISRGDISWHLLQQNLNKSQRKAFKETNLIFPQTAFLQNKSSSSSVSSFSIIYNTQEIIKSPVRECARELLVTPGIFKESRMEQFNNDAIKRKSNIRRGIMLATRQKEMLGLKGNSPGLREYVYGPEIKSLLFTPIMDLIRKEFNLDEYSYLKLISFNDEDLQEIRDLSRNKLRRNTWTVKSRDGLFIKTMNEYITNEGIRPDWCFFKSLCEILEAKQPVVYTKNNPGVLHKVPVVAPTKSVISIQDLIRVEELEIEDALHSLSTYSFDKPFENFAKTILENKVIHAKAEIERLRSKLANT